MKTISVTLPNALDAKLTSVARRRRTTKSAIVRAALGEYLARHAEPHPESFAALAKEFIGCVSGGPPDLSYNKKHMEGFGRD
jgi:predicted DNA-binding protein